MRADAVELEQSRMKDLTIESYPWIHERHRAFPEIFEDRGHERIIDLASGIGIVAKRIIDHYECEMVCNEIDPSCLHQLKRLDVKTTSFDLDTGNPLPLKDEAYDAVLSLATLEHIIHTEKLIMEMRRILADDGRLYISVPNYASIFYMIPLLKGRTFHDPLDPVDRYEFFAHVRYFTYRTLVDLFKSFDLHLDTVYLALPSGSTRYKRLRERSKWRAFVFRNAARLLYTLSPRWHAGPIMCFSKEEVDHGPRIVRF